MSDVLLSALLGSAQLQTVSSSSAPNATTSQVPPSIANLPTGSLIKGFVVNRDAQNNPILRTPKGDVLVKSELFLKTGSEVVIRVSQHGGQFSARIIAVDNVPLQELIQQQQNAKPGDSIQQQSMTAASNRANPAQFPNATSQPIIQASLLTPANYGNSEQSLQTIASILKLPVASLSQMEKGVPLTFRLIDSQLASQPPGTMAQRGIGNWPLKPMQGELFQPPTTQSGQPVASQYGAYARGPGGQSFTVHSMTPHPANPATGATAPATTSPAAGAQTPAAVNTGLVPSPPSPSAALPQLSPGTPPAPSPAASALASANPAPALVNSNAVAEINPATIRPGTIAVRVIGTEPDGHTIVRSSVGTMRLFTSVAPPVGSTLRLELVPTTQQALTSTSSPALSSQVIGLPAEADAPEQVTLAQRVAQASQLSASWDSLKDAASLLRADASAQYANLSERIPNTKSAMVNSVLFFLSALKSGEMRRWFGNAAALTIEERAPALAKRLQSDMNGLRSLATERPDSNWQMLFFPLMHEDELHQARLFLRRDDHADAAEPEEENRFVLEVDLSELGTLQIDGLMHGKPSHKQFDLVIRSEKTLPETIQSDIRAIYQQAADISGLGGAMRFVAGAETLLKPLQDDIQAHQQNGPDGSIFA